MFDHVEPEYVVVEHRRARRSTTKSVGCHIVRTRIFHDLFGGWIRELTGDNRNNDGQENEEIRDEFVSAEFGLHGSGQSVDLCS